MVHSPEENALCQIFSVMLTAGTVVYIVINAPDIALVKNAECILIALSCQDDGFIVA
jgi:hypothetical protein